MGGTIWSGDTTTRIALDVPIVSAQYCSATQPEPTLAAAPSPIAGNQGTSCNAGQREANGGVSPCKLSFRSPRGGSCSGLIPSLVASFLSQVRLCVTSSPVPEAIERLHTERPNILRCKYSPKESHWVVRANTSGRVVANQRSLAGQ